MTEIKYNKGQSLFEVLLALAVITLIIVAVVILSTNSVRNSNFSKNKTLSARYTQEAIEWLRKERDKDTSNFFARASVPIYCLHSLNWTLAGTCAPSRYIANTNFYRKVNFTTNSFSGNTFIEAVVTVYWTDSQGSHESKSTTTFNDPRQQ